MKYSPGFRYQTFGGWKRAVKKIYSVGTVSFFGDKDIRGANVRIWGLNPIQCAEWDGEKGQIWDVSTGRDLRG